MNKFLFVLFFPSLVLFGKTPLAVYLTLGYEPSTSMTVYWLTSKKDLTSVVNYRAETENEWRVEEGKVKSLKGTGVVTHVLELNHLSPGTVYIFQIKDTKKEYRFRTLPREVSSLRFAVGGDAYYYLSRFQKMNANIAQFDPDFVVVGGDIAYARSNLTPFKGAKGTLKRWQTFFTEWESTMVSSDGRMIPMVIVTGNHDVKGTLWHPREKYPFFYSLFSFPEEGIPFRVIDLGKQISLFLLDTGHSFPVGGRQTEWLNEALSARADVPFKMAAYHISAYPSAHPYMGSTSIKIRRLWVPLFEKYGMQTAFEHHNHTYKRTYPIKEGKIDPTGVIYLGDGSWGISPRKVHKEWYLARAEPWNAVWLVTVEEKGTTFTSIGMQGEIIEQVEVLPKPSYSAACE